MSCIKIVFFCIMMILTGCQSNIASKYQLEVVTVAQFEAFVDATDYITDAEKYGWSIVQQDVFNYQKVYGATWRKPDGLHAPSSKNLPVTQVSYNDAMAYCNWSGTRLPSYSEYWQFTQNDHRLIVAQNNLPISPVSEVNTVGNVWEITSSQRGAEVRLAGGSLYCSPTVCNGMSAARELYVDTQTGNIHIGFAVLHEN